jgi:hypothetical protein
MAGALAVVAAVVLTPEELAGLAVDGNALAVGPVSVPDFEIVARDSEAVKGFRREAVPEVQLVGQVLGMKARGVDGVEAWDVLPVLRRREIP